MARKLRFLMLIALVVAVCSPLTGNAYTLLPSQVIELMTRRFAYINTLQITEITTIKELDPKAEQVFGEIVYMMSPDSYRTEVAGQPRNRLIAHRGSRTLKIVNGMIVYDGESINFLHRLLFLNQDPGRLAHKLQRAGIDLYSVFLTKLEGNIAYSIGGNQEGNPRLLVDKQRFLPLLLAYDNVRFQFSDYREVAERIWYPFHISTSLNGTITEENAVKGIAVNPPLDPSLFDLPLIGNRFRSGESEKRPTLIADE